MKVSVIVPTHNRLDDLRRTLAVLARLDPAPDEVLLTADGCTDGTLDFLRAEYPQHRVIVNARGQGSTASRDRMAREASGDLLLSIDDDSYPLEPDAIARLRRMFAERPRLAVASFPQRTNEFSETLAMTHFGPPQFVGTYVNCACAFRRKVLVDLGGHFGPFWNAYDEPDFALRCVSAGWEVRFEPSIFVRHHYSAVNRDELRMHRQHARNELWSVLMRCPLPWLPAVALFRAARQFRYALHRGAAWVAREPEWWGEALRGAPRALRERRPVTWRAYLAWMKLVRHPITDEREWAARFGQSRQASPLAPSRLAETA